MNSQTKLCRNFKAYFITGMGAAIEYIEYIKAKQKLIIQTALFGDYYDIDKLEIIGNWTAMPWHNNDELVDKIIDIIENSSFSCGKIMLVFLGHSHGAKIIADAYSKLQNKYSGAPNIWEAIYDKSALFTLGGVSYVDDSMAQITLNVVFDNDDLSRACRIMKIGNQKLGWVMTIGPYRQGVCMCCDDRQSTTNSDDTNIKEAGNETDGYLDQTGCLAKLSSKFSSNVSEQVANTSLELAKIVVPAFSVKSSGKAQKKIRDFCGSTDPAHFLDHYLKCRSWRAQIRNMLQTNQYKATCTCQHLNR